MTNYDKPCPNCKSLISNDDMTCPNCGWQPDQFDEAPSAESPRSKVYVYGMTLFGFVLGTVLTFFGTVIVLVGPIAVVVVYLNTRRSVPYFANSLLAGAAVGLIGVFACFMSLRSLM